jgi:hypothetical protein
VKPALLFCLAWIFSLNAFGQSSRVFTGIALFPTLARSSEPGSLSKFSLNGELRIRLRLSDYIALETGPGFINHGFRYKTNFKDSVTQEEWTVVDPFQINYFTLPLRLRFINNGFTLAGGFTPEIFLNANPARFNRDIRQTTFAWQFSAGYQLELYGGGILAFELFHTQPFQTIFRDSRFQNSGLALSAIFPLSGPGGFGE